MQILGSTPLFEVGSARGPLDDPHMYDVTADGQRFLINVAEEQQGAPITVVLNWTSSLNR